MPCWSLRLTAAPLPCTTLTTQRRSTRMSVHAPVRYLQLYWTTGRSGQICSRCVARAYVVDVGKHSDRCPIFGLLGQTSKHTSPSPAHPPSAHLCATVYMLLAKCPCDSKCKGLQARSGPLLLIALLAFASASKICKILRRCSGFRPPLLLPILITRTVFAGH